MKRLFIGNPFPDAHILYKIETVSTMDDSRELAKNDVQHGMVVAAGYQSGGRGRGSGRRWVSNPGENLLFTLILAKNKINVLPNLIPLLIGSSISGLLEELFQFKAEVKWPNDVLINGKKISGILCEAKGDYIFAGIGINCNQVEFPADISNYTCSIASLTGSQFGPLFLLEKLLEQIYNDLNRKNWKKDYLKRLYKIGETVTVLNGNPDSGEKITGVLSGIGENGELILTLQNSVNTRKIVSGEIVWKIPFMSV